MPGEKFMDSVHVITAISSIFWMFLYLREIWKKNKPLKDAKKRDLAIKTLQLDFDRVYVQMMVKSRLGQNNSREIEALEDIQKHMLEINDAVKNLKTK
jgi:hypothetical protein